MSRCAIVSDVRPAVTATAARSRSRAPADPASAVASSSTTTSGSASSTRASASCWASAGVRVSAPSPTVVSSPSGSASTLDQAPTARSACSSAASSASGAARVRLSRTVPVKTCTSWLTSATGGRPPAVDVVERDAAEDDLAAGRDQPTGDRGAERRLPGARGADDRDPLARVGTSRSTSSTAGRPATYSWCRPRTVEVRVGGRLRVGHRGGGGRSSASPASRVSEAPADWTSSKRVEQRADRVEQPVEEQRRGGDRADRHLVARGPARSRCRGSAAARSARPGWSGRRSG